MLILEKHIKLFLMQFTHKDENDFYTSLLQVWIGNLTSASSLDKSAVILKYDHTLN